MKNADATRRANRKAGNKQRQFWASTQFGRDILEAEKQQAAQWLMAMTQSCTLELSAIETSPMDYVPHIRFQAARSSWQSPVISQIHLLPIQSRSVDLVIWRYLPLEWEQRDALCESIRRVLAPGGHLLLFSLNPLHNACWNCYGVYNIGNQSAAAITPVARKAGLTVIQRKWLGPGYWRFAALQAVLLQKKCTGYQLQHRIKRRVLSAAPVAQ